MDSPPPTNNSSETRKRPSKSSRAFYPRKRALLACQLCRRRKSKCNNARPTCGSCQELQVECHYGDSKSDHSTYDLASLEILEQIGHVAQLLETQNAQLSGLMPTLLSAQHAFSPPVSSDLSNDHTNSLYPFIFNTIQYANDVLDHDEPRDEATLLSESLGFAETATIKCEDLFEWPVFEGKFHRSETENLIFNPDLAYEGQQMLDSCANSDLSRRSVLGRGIHEDDAPALIANFLANVHIKNPILNADDIIKMARDVTEHGFKWDAPSCLVLIACALGCLSSPYTSDCITPQFMQCTNVYSSIDDATNYSDAESYYIASQKRIGLLKYSILASQCSFLSGVYEMYSLRPLRAWSSFNSACVMLQIYLKTKDRTKDCPEETLERRLYWSCLKSECEIRNEICLPPSGLAKVNYPDVFPSPPIGSPPSIEASMVGTGAYPSGSQRSILTPELVRRWGYYLSDIAVRRIANRLVNAFYQDSASSWLSMPIDRMIRVAKELELQLTQWYDNLPAVVTTSEPPSPSYRPEELRSLPHLRFLEFLERIYRPFLYLAIHLEASSPIHQIIEPYVERCLSACIDIASKGINRHRHHGTWYLNRTHLCDCVVLLAAVKSRRVNVPEGWRDAVNLSIVGLKFWEREAPDLRRGREILEIILGDIDESGI